MWMLDLFCEYAHKFPRQNAFLFKACDLFCLHVGPTPESIQNDKAHGIHINKHGLECKQGNYTYFSPLQGIPIPLNALF
jgi:hypothetical protein